MKALILSCNTGQGHNSCSAAIKECFEAHGTVCDVTDALGFISQGVSKFISKGHVFVYRHMPWLFRRGYRYSERHGEYLGKSLWYTGLWPEGLMACMISSAGRVMTRLSAPMFSPP